METTERVRMHGDEITVTEKSWGQEEKVWFFSPQVVSVG
jgi:hypothetical protein